MPDQNPSQPGRRDFLRSAALMAGAATLPARAAAEPAADAPVAPVGYLSFSPDEAALVEAMVDVMCPADELTPRGVDCGLAHFIDRQLAGAYGKGERLYLRGPFRPGRPEDGYQLPLTPEQFFKAGAQAADAACLRRHQRRFAELTPEEGDPMLQAVADGREDAAGFPLAEWFNELVYPLFVQACFADPIYGGNRDKVFWKMLGYPGLPAVNGLNMVKYRGKPFPGARQPKSIEDFS
ncbi:MAG: gluconate 2-dehydrogenase subunit 3 family protein [Opitutaceae bacterium]|nr:gluconate 2-dehydrogenase subunit 3 family protein [Opitutaceae bacterium]